MTLSRHRIEDLSLARDHLARVRRANVTSLRNVRHELLKTRARAEREQQNDFLPYLTTVLDALDDALESIE